MPHSSSASEKVEGRSGSYNRPAPQTRSHQEKASQQQPSPSVTPIEPEDARVTGTSRSLQRRVLGLNVEGGQAHGHPENPPAQHATGSFTGKSRERKAG